jgi:hypothetical protein
MLLIPPPRHSMSWLGDLPPRRLYTYSRNGVEHEFWIHFDDHGFAKPTEFVARVRLDREWPPRDWMSYAVSFVQIEGELQTINMENGKDPRYSKKGIGVALLPAVSRTLSCDIVSSPTFRDLSQRRSEDATRVWEALVSLGLAKLEGDRYRLDGQRAKSLPERRGN